MAKSIHRVTTVVRNIKTLCPDVCQLTLSDPDGWDLPPYTPGAHVDVHLPSGTIRQYSLCGDPADRSAYVIAVKQDPTGRGGSQEVHQLGLGHELLLSLPRNLFEFAIDGPAVLIAGGIGITPFLSALPQLATAASNTTLHVCAPSPEETPFHAQLATLPQVRFHFGSDGTRLELKQLLAETPQSTPLYCCGPSRMINDLTRLAERSGHKVIVEHFGANAEPAQKAYEVKIASTGQIVAVGAGQTMLDALRLAEIDVPASCEAGICMDCKTRYLEGAADHKDILLPTHERATHLTPCVSGCRGDQITLDL